MAANKTTDKVIVTHFTALKSKYGAAGLAKIQAAAKKMIAADARRGIATRMIAVDSAANMKGIGKACPFPATPRQAKTAIDKIHAALYPDYIMILGAPDVFPMQRLQNPLFTGDPDGDTDRNVPSDLPYACDVPFSTDPNRFLGPTRVVGRLPDIVKAGKPDYILKLLATATTASKRTADEYSKYFGLTADIWRASTALSLKRLFGDSAALNRSPPTGPRWTRTQLKPRVHFINCHGNTLDPSYVGQPKSGAEEYPDAHLASWLPGKILDGTVMVAECCYGAEMYDPAMSLGQKGIAYTYLGEGAYGVFGSSTIAYGPSSGNGLADLICRFFLEAVLQGSSLGRAVLEARQRFAETFSHMSPEDLKTISQFYLLGDPSIHPVAVSARALNKTSAFKKAFAKSQDAGVRSLRREKLRRVGMSLARDLPKTLPKQTLRMSSKVKAAVEGVQRETGFKILNERHFEIVPRQKKGSTFASRHTVHVMVGQDQGTKLKPKPGDKADARRVVLLVATARDGELLHLRRLHSR